MRRSIIVRLQSSIEAVEILFLTAEDKSAERSTLILQFERLIAPVAVLAEKSPPPQSTDYRIAAATFAQDFGRWRVEISRFVNVGNVTLGYELADIVHWPKALGVEIARLAKDSRWADDKKRLVELQACLARCQGQTMMYLYMYDYPH